MQAFSGMRRNSSNIQLLKSVFLIVFLLTYQAITTVITWLPPLIGLFFTYLIILEMHRRKWASKYNINRYFAIAYITFAEQAHGFALFSAILSFILFHRFICDWLIVTFKSRAFLLVLFVVSGYLGVYITSSTILYILDLPILNLDYKYAVYILIESVFAVIIFRGLIK